MVARVIEVIGKESAFQARSVPIIGTRIIGNKNSYRVKDRIWFKKAVKSSIILNNKECIRSRSYPKENNVHTGPRLRTPPQQRTFQTLNSALFITVFSSPKPSLPASTGVLKPSFLYSTPPMISTSSLIVAGMIVPSAGKKWLSKE